MTTLRTLRIAKHLVRQRVGPPRAKRAVLIARGALAHGAQQKLSEFAPFIGVVLKAKPRYVVEIGRGSGGSLFALCQASAPNATIVSIDLPNGPFGGSSREVADAARLQASGRAHQSLHLLYGDSKEEAVLSAVKTLVPSVDLLFIDGDHTYDGVVGAYERYRLLVRPGGIIAFHDILPHDGYPSCQVARLWNQLEGRKTEITSPSERHARFGRWGGIGILRI